MTVTLSKMEYVKLRAPKRHGEVLCRPNWEAVPGVWNENLRRLRDSSRFKGDAFLAELRGSAKREVVKLAVEYTSQYRAIKSGLADRAQILASGHQPQLFHAGVWYKNFTLSQWAEKLDAVPINLLIDNDVCSGTSIKVPVGSELKPQLQRIEYDESGPVIPFELRPTISEATFDQFEKRVSAALAQRIAQPILKQLWNFRDDVRFLPTLGQRLAAMRNLLESAWGWETLEVPLSRVCHSESFAKFAVHLLGRATELQQIYNSALAEYRQVHRVRSASHPVPALATSDAWTEVPFWVYSSAAPTRQRVFVRQEGERLTLSDLKTWSETHTDDEWCERLQDSRHDIRLRPRALMTTCYGRLVVSTMFIHGIGGAKYDQLTDRLMQELWGIEPPEFLTVTATAQLPIESPNVQGSDVTRVAQQLRELEYHPEDHLDPATASDEVLDQVQQKQSWLQQSGPYPFSRQRYLAITQLNEQLHGAVASKRQQLESEHSRLKHEARIHQMLGSREFSFCLFPEQTLRPMFEQSIEPRS